ncbi:MAG: helix-turn-helix domain-containing protein [Actinomycetota bacterium]|nr:helix-turn-helix domain-containing protein [Actinomycetota bacterium]
MSDPRLGTTEDARPGVEPRLLTLDDVATYLAVSVRQVYSLVRSNELPGIKIGGRGIWRVDRRELDAYVDRLRRDTEEWVNAHPLSTREGV